MHTFTLIFLIALVTMAAVEFWLARRHIAHVQAHRSTVPKAFSENISLEAHQKAADYTIAKTRFGMFNDGIGVALLLIWTLGGGLDLLDNIWHTSGWSSLFMGAGFILSLFLIMGILNIPSSLYSTFVIEEKFGFNKMNLKMFFVDMAKNTVLLLLIGSPLIFAVLWLMQSMGQYWWFYVWVLWVSFSLFMVWAYPVLIAPLFNKFKPLEKDSTRERIQALLKRTGFKSKGIFIMDGSKRSAHGNAYFTGFGKNKRIVFFDTLLKTLKDTEIEAVLAHELGHFKHFHIVKRMIVIFSMALLGLALLGWLLPQAWFFTALGVSQPSTYVGLILFMMISPVFTFLMQPLSSWSSRKHEFEADAFAAEHAEAHDLVTALVKMYEENAATLTPDPVHSIFYDSHPPAPLRISHLQAQGSH